LKTDTPGFGSVEIAARHPGVETSRLASDTAGQQEEIMNLNCDTCERTFPMPYIADRSVAIEAGYASGWAISPDAALCPACATALLANRLLQESAKTGA